MIENVGHRTAKNIRFTLSAPLPNRWAGGWGKNHPEAGDMTTGPLIEGIPALGPGDRRVMFWGTFLNLHPILGNQVIRVNTRFDSDPLLPFGRPSDHAVENLLEVQSFVATDAVDPDGARQSAKELKRIADVVEKRLRAGV